MNEQENCLVRIIYVPELGCRIELPIAMKINQQLLRMIQVAVQDLIYAGVRIFPTLQKEASEQQREV